MPTPTTQLAISAGRGETTGIGDTATEAAGAPRARRSGSGRSARSIRRRAGGVAIAVAVWEIASITGAVSSRELASVPATFATIGRDAGPLATGVATTLEAWAIGLAIAVVAGITLGTLVGRSRVADAATELVVRMMRPMPSLALIPVAILVAGLGLRMTSGLVAFAAFWPVLINTRYGVGQVDNRLLESARSVELRGFPLLVEVVLPAASPLIDTGLRVAMSQALVVTVSVELVGGTGGLGQYVLVAQQAGDIPSMYAGIIVGGILGWALNTAYALASRRALAWHYRGGSPA